MIFIILLDVEIYSFSFIALALHLKVLERVGAFITNTNHQTSIGKIIYQCYQIPLCSYYGSQKLFKF